MATLRWTPPRMMMLASGTSAASSAMLADVGLRCAVGDQRRSRSARICALVLCARGDQALRGLSPPPRGGVSSEGSFGSPPPGAPSHGRSGDTTVLPTATLAHSDAPSSS